MKNITADRRSTTWTIVAISFLLLVVFGDVQSARGQQWTGTTDISNTNSGNVGVGTTTPSQKLHVVGATRIDAPSGSNLQLFYNTSTATTPWSIYFDSSNLAFYNRGGGGNLILS